MTNERKPRRDHRRVQSRLDVFNAYMRRMPEWAYWSLVFALGVAGGAVYLIVTA